MNLKHAVEAVLFAALVAGLDEAGTIDIAEVIGLHGDEGALVTGIITLILAYAQRWAKEQEEHAEGGDNK